jgi:hypothetical protein
MSSGYPSAERLRIILGGRQEFMEHMREQEDPKSVNSTRAKLLDLRDRFKDSLDTFRFGCFGSIDEFCKLSGNNRSSQVQDLKKMVRMALAVVDAERNYTKSDYYPFVQRLFKADSCEFRDDIAVLTYNYDPYLPYLLKRSAEHRGLAHSSKIARKPRRQ